METWQVLVVRETWQEQCACEFTLRPKFNIEGWKRPRMTRWSFLLLVQCSSSILSLMRKDSEQHFRLSQRRDLCDVPMVSPNWPFVGCCQIVASYGYALSISKHNKIVNLVTSEDHQRTEWWRRREIISNMGFAEASLGNLAHVWKASAVYRQAVHQCRLALEQDLDDTIIASARRIAY